MRSFLPAVREFSSCNKRKEGFNNLDKNDGVKGERKMIVEDKNCSVYGTLYVFVE